MVQSSQADVSWLSLSVIIPIRNGREHLPACLDALSTSLRKPDEIVVVDDSSEDGSAAVALACNCKVVSLGGGGRGAASARNRGVAASSGEILVFIDSDVVVHPETLLRIEQQFLMDTDLSGLFGSYDDTPVEPGAVSSYRNLLHHYIHKNSRRNASTFWAGCGAIRREAFFAVGGFDETYRWLEDIELGLRLCASNRRILLCPEIQVTHRKRWTFSQMIYSDIMHRTVPWTRLILRHRFLPDDLNLRHEHRFSALAAWLVVGLAAMAPSHRLALDVALLPIAVLLGYNWDLYRLFQRKGGLFFSLGAIGLHWLHYLYTSATFTAVVVGSCVRRHVAVRNADAASIPREVASLPCTD